MYLVCQGWITHIVFLCEYSEVLKQLTLGFVRMNVWYFGYPIKVCFGSSADVVFQEHLSILNCSDHPLGSSTLKASTLICRKAFPSINA